MTLNRGGEVQFISSNQGFNFNGKTLVTYFPLKFMLFLRVFKKKILLELSNQSFPVCKRFPMQTFKPACGVFLLKNIECYFLMNWGKNGG